MYKIKCELMYRWCMAHAYLTQYYAPVVSSQWERDADFWRMELWRIERGFV